MLSVTTTVNVKGPGVVGIPVSVPVGDNAKPGGNAPSFTDQLYDAWPPVAVRRCEYKLRVAALSEEETGGMDSKGPAVEAAAASSLKAPRPFVNATTTFVVGL